MKRSPPRSTLGRAVCGAGLLVASAFAHPSVAAARVQRDLDYGYDQVWGTLVRLLHVDYRYPVDEQDQPHGYVLFHYVEYGRRHAASVELVRVSESATRTRLVVQVEGVPTHLEAQILDDLERKLRTEVGRPVRPPVVASADRPATQPSTVPRLRDRPEDSSRPRGDRDEPSDEAPTEPRSTDTAGEAPASRSRAPASRSGRRE